MPIIPAIPSPPAKLPANFSRLRKSCALSSSAQGSNGHCLPGLALSLFSGFAILNLMIQFVAIHILLVVNGTRGSPVSTNELESELFYHSIGSRILRPRFAEKLLKLESFPKKMGRFTHELRP